MKIKSLKLRGAIGIKKGLGLDEIEIDFSKFSPGLIALTGRNGSGKTTIMENLHPYRMMVSRDGSLEGHFFLKDSCRTLSFEYEGSQYKSDIRIDGVTGASEAYLYKDGVALNDGLKGTYDKVLENILGSPELFFNSVFCGQKAKGVAELKPGERRALFYELLNLNIYQAKCDAAKDKLKEQQTILSRIESEILQLESKSGEYEELEYRKNCLEEQNKAVLGSIENHKKELAAAEKEIRETEIKIARLQEKEKQNEVLKDRISQQQKAIEEIKAGHLETMKDLAGQERARLTEIEEDPEYHTRVKQNKNELSRIAEDTAAEIKTRKEESRLRLNEKIRAQSDLKDTESLIERAEKLTANKDLIAEKLNWKKDLTARMETLQDEYKKVSEELSMQSEACGRLREQFNSCVSAGDKIHTSIRQAKDELLRTQAQLHKTQKDCEILGRVPCDFNIGKGCQFVTNAFQDKLRLPELESAVSEWESKISEFEGQLKESTQKEMEAHLELKKANAEAESVKLRLIECNSGITKVKMELDTLNREGWETLEKEAAEADTQIRVLSEKKARLNETIERMNADIIRITDVIKALEYQAKEKMDALEREAEFLASEHSKKIAENERIWTEKRDLITKSTNDRVSELQAAVSALLDEIYCTDIELPGLNEALANLKNTIEDTKDEIEHGENVLRMNAEELSEINARLKEKAAADEKLKALREEKTGAEQEIKDWSFLTRAFDKTGIPVLKLENSGIEITALANELLSIFDNKFRIVIETTRLKANKKDLKETFDINVIEDDGMCEISNKSGGQQVWLETAIQLAISRVVRQQGRNIQTSFLDEKDGALDLENAYAYYEMLQKNHELSGVYNTFVITHRPELLDYIPQQVKLKDGVLEIQN